MKTKHLIFILLLAGIFYGAYYIYERIPVVSGYAAKNLCSCVFLAERDENHVKNNELQFSLIKYASTKVDYNEQSVEASIFGLGKQKAYFNPDLGCALTYDREKFLSLKSTSRVNSNIPDTLYFPYGNLINDTFPSNINKSEIDKAVNFLFEDSDTSKPFFTRGVVVLYDGQIIGEQYAEGFDKNTRQLGWSMGKSISSALIGVMVQKQLISDIHSSIPIKEWNKDDRSKITWNNVLQMSSGLKWTEDYADISEATIMLYLRENMYTYACSRPLIDTPNTNWIYSSGSSNILSGIIQEIVGKDYLDFPYNELFTKIGANSMFLETDANGNFVGSSYPWATARDWAKFGQLYLNKGKWRGEQIFPDWWAEYTAQPADASNGEYGAQFWLQNEKEFPDVPKDMYFADGFQGQRVFIIPSKKIIAVRLGTSIYEQPDYNEFLKLIINAIN